MSHSFVLKKAVRNRVSLSINSSVHAFLRRCVHPSVCLSDVSVHPSVRTSVRATIVEKSGNEKFRPCPRFPDWHWPCVFVCIILPDIDSFSVAHVFPEVYFRNKSKDKMIAISLSPEVEKLVPLVFTVIFKIIHANLFIFLIDIILFLHK